MIEKIYGFYHLVCDICGQEARINFAEFDSAVKFKKDEGWKSRREGARWCDVCPDCQGRYPLFYEDGDDEVLRGSMDAINEVINALSPLRVNVATDEYEIQNKIEKLLNKSGVSYRKEHRLAPRNRVDFFTESGVAVEVKKGKPNRMLAIRQLERYASFPEVKAVILVVETSLKVPKTVNRKPCISFGLHKLWGIAL